MLEILGKVGFDWQVALANLVNFAIVFVVLNFLVFKPLKKVITERQSKIQQGLDDAEKAKSALVEASAQKEELMRDAYKESQDIVGGAKDERNKIIATASALAEDEASKIRQNAIDDADAILRKADQDLNEKAVSVIVDGMEKVLKESMTKDINEKFIATVLK